MSSIIFFGAQGCDDDGTPVYADAAAVTDAGARDADPVADAGRATEDAGPPPDAEPPAHDADGTADASEPPDASARVEATAIIPGTASNALFGTDVALSADGSRLIVGARGYDAGLGPNAGQTRVYERGAAGWAQLGQALDGEATDDYSGAAVAISNDGSRIAIGAPRNDGSTNRGGHVRVYDLVGGVWTQVGADIDSTPPSTDSGASLALSASGARIIVGAPQAASVNGSARVYELVDGRWTQLGQVIAGDHETGYAVDISDDGNRIVVASPSAQSSDRYPGRVTVYDLDGGTWTQFGEPRVGESDNEYFGSSVALSADGQTLAVGGQTTDQETRDSGVVRVFRLDGGAFVQLGVDLPGAATMGLGWSISMSADATRVIAGGPNGVSASARLYFAAAAEWVEQTAFDLPLAERAGEAVAIAADGRTVAVSIPYSDIGGNLSGEVRVYELE